MRQRYPIQMQVVEKDSGNIVFKASLPVESIFNSSSKFDELLAYVERKYTQTIRECKELLKRSTFQKRANSKVYWIIGDSILKFMRSLEDTPFYLRNQCAFFARDLGLSQTSIWKIIRFRKKFPKKDLIDPTIPWSLYREGRVELSR
ncbi:hypothetical protein DRZ78_02155 [Candidatus Aerophobetes bacterium]|uniref:Uncharacterized protein n=1 Tax=Aerophobetes bacterium TaxID=2030807 RepID=A0A662D5E8_UNCAE|nr:MAG: hypothetical protein DRZ78_02155 [Candidatus Aerophobetes bacterium]